MRPPERIFLAFFAYIAALGIVMPARPGQRWQPVLCLVSAAILFGFLSRFRSGAEAVSILRDWLPIPFTLMAFREMEIFAPARYPMTFENAWIKLDQAVLHDLGLRAAIESLGKLVPFYLEFCYLLVYGLAAYAVGLIALKSGKSPLAHRTIDYFWIVYLTGTLTAYALFPYFPSLPPRYAFPWMEPPRVATWVRTFNLFLLRGATIHTGVFPSAHVSSAFSAAWALYFIYPKRRWAGSATLVYAVSVSIATVYGRYHYVSDVLGGFAVSMGALGIGFAMRNYVQKHQSA